VAVRHFPRYHKYTLGTEIRQQAMQICRLIGQAWRNKQAAVPALRRLINAVDDLKLQIQLAKQLQALRNFAHFQRLSELAVSVGKQSGGWYRRASKQPESVVKATERAESLCKHTASTPSVSGHEKRPEAT